MYSGAPFFVDLVQYHAEVVELSFAETEPVILNKVREALQNTPGITNVAFVHCDTSSGNVAPAKEIIEIVCKDAS